jgi:AcrR family transcriptional regulator
VDAVAPEGGDRPGARPARLTREERRAQLLDTTRTIVAADGFHAVTIDRVARAAGVSRPIVYEHFTDLEGLLRALLEREGARAMGQLAAVMPAPQAGPVADVLIATLGAYLAAVQEDPVTWRLMLMPPEGAPVFLRERVEQTRAQVVAQLTEILEPPGGGALGSPDPPLLASSIEALAVHWSRLVLGDPGQFDPERILAAARWAVTRIASGSP